MPKDDMRKISNHHRRFDELQRDPSKCSSAFEAFIKVMVWPYQYHNYCYHLSWTNQCRCLKWGWNLNEWIRNVKETRKFRERRKTKKKFFVAFIWYSFRCLSSSWNVNYGRQWSRIQCMAYRFSFKHFVQYLSLIVSTRIPFPSECTTNILNAPKNVNWTQTKHEYKVWIK